MITLLLSLVLSASAPATVAAQSCETFAPNLDGISVTVCDGHVESRTDSLGVTHYSFNDNIDAF